MRQDRDHWSRSRSGVAAERAVEESVQRAAQALVLVDALLGRQAGGGGRRGKSQRPSEAPPQTNKHVLLKA